MKKFNIETNSYVEVETNIGYNIMAKEFIVILDSEYYELGILTKTEPHKYTIEIISKYESKALNET